ncbi:hypothetical protein LTR17_010102 [Elasticomyces elasticus]|nr:hypothetical protein LTR17_010102 [Elasticomyces elasticus]
MPDDLRRDSMGDDDNHILPLYTPGVPPPTYDASNDAAALRPVAVSYTAIVFHPSLGADDRAESSRVSDQGEEAVAMEPMSEAADRRWDATTRAFGVAAMVVGVIFVIGMAVGLGVGLGLIDR